jgi:hypothetical protein
MATRAVGPASCTNGRASSTRSTGGDLGPGTQRRIELSLAPSPAGSGHIGEGVTHVLGQDRQPCPGTGQLSGVGDGENFVYSVKAPAAPARKGPARSAAEPPAAGPTCTSQLSHERHGLDELLDLGVPQSCPIGRNVAVTHGASAVSKAPNSMPPARRPGRWLPRAHAVLFPS